MMSGIFERSLDWELEGYVYIIQNIIVYISELNLNGLHFAVCWGAQRMLSFIAWVLHTHLIKAKRLNERVAIVDYKCTSQKYVRLIS